MKKIDGWLGSPPLLRFDLFIKFDQNFNVKISDGKKITECVDSFYKNEPTFHLSRHNEIEIPKTLRPGRGFIYTDKAGNNSINIGKNFIKYQFKKYSKWEKILDQISQILLNFRKNFGFEQITNISFLYIDRFIVKNEGDVINNNFNLKIDFPSTFKIDYQDFTIGYILKNTEEMKLIQRLKGRFDKKELNEDQIYYIIENDYRYYKNYKITSLENLKEFLTKIHDEINNYFIELIENRIGNNERYRLKTK